MIFVIRTAFALPILLLAACLLMTAGFVGGRKFRIKIWEGFNRAADDGPDWL